MQYTWLMLPGVPEKEYSYVAVYEMRDIVSAQKLCTVIVL